MAIKRLNYFDHQFLIEADFTAQQDYHLFMRRHLNHVLHTFGIAEGLEVSKTANKAVTVKFGTAIDRDGREMLLEANKVIDLSDPTQFPAGATVHITAAYKETPSDQSTATGAAGNTRITEEAVILATRVAPSTDGTVIRLATFKLDDSANVPGNINDSLDGGVRQRVTPRAGLGLLSLHGVNNPGGNIDLLTTQSIVITPNDVNNRITIGENHSIRTDNPHQTTAAQVGALTSLEGVSNHGGNIDLIPTQSIVITPDDANNRITIGENHSARNDNPHQTTAAQVGALTSLMGVSNPGGNIDLHATGSIKLTTGPPSNRITIGENHSSNLENPHQTTAAQVGAMLASEYDLRRRTIVSVGFSEAQKDGSQSTIPTPFLPRVIIITGICSSKLTTNTYSGGVSGFGFFDSGTLNFMSVGFGLTKTSATDVVTRGILSKTLVASSFVDHTATPKPGENLSITLFSVSANALVVQFNRSVLSAAFVALPDFSINLQLLLMGERP